MEENPTAIKIIEAAEELMLSKSFHAVGLNEILKTVGVPKGSFYHHFKSKEDFGARMMKYYIDEDTKARRDGFADPAYGSNAIERIFGFWEVKMNEFVRNGCECPCLLLKLTAEVSGSSDVMRRVMEAGLRTWQDIYEVILSQAVADGHLAQDVDVEEESLYLMNYWYGAVQHAMTLRQARPIEVAFAHLKQHFMVSLAPSSR